jgi:hypothetical protein
MARNPAHPTTCVACQTGDEDDTEHPHPAEHCWTIARALPVPVDFARNLFGKYRIIIAPGLLRYEDYNHALSLIHWSFGSYDYTNGRAEVMFRTREDGEHALDTLRAEGIIR